MLVRWIIGAAIVLLSTACAGQRSNPALFERFQQLDGNRDGKLTREARADEL